MCGRFTQTRSREEVLKELCHIELPPLFHQRYNIAPTQTVGIIRQDRPERTDESIWGLKNRRDGSMIINARGETLTERPMFKQILATNRCLIPADGFYEWKGKQPYLFQPEDKRIFAFAGLWINDRCVIVTRSADANMKGIHHRMPVIFSWNESYRWLETFHLPEAPRLMCRPVSRRVNSVIHDDPSCLDSADVQTDLSLFPEDD